MPVERAAARVPPNFPSVATTMISRTGHPAVPAADEADLGAHAGEGEERRQQQHEDETLEAVRERVRQPAVVRHDGAEQERAEQRVDADRFGHERG